MSARTGGGARFSLRLRLTLLAAVAAAVVLTLGALLLYSGLFSAVDRAVTAELRVRSDDVTVQLGAGTPLVLGGGLLTQVVAPGGRVLAPEGDDPVVEALELEGVDRLRVIDRPVEGIGDNARLLIRRAELAEGEDAFVVVAGSTAPIERAQGRLQVVLGVAGPAMVLVVAAMAWVLTGASLRPVSRMTRRAASISMRDVDERLPVPPGRDEIAELGATLNRMLDRIAQTLSHERMFVDDASHELRTPLAVLRSELELARLEVDDDPRTADIRDAIDSALEETDRLTALTERLLVLARADAGHLIDEAESVNVADVVDAVLARVEPGELTVETEIDEVDVVADVVLFERLLTNLVTNAFRWARSRVRVETARAGDELLLRVADDGPGFDPALAGRVFDRFSRTGAARNRDGGSGLGLAIVAAIAGALGGRAEATNGPPLGGARVEVRLPVATSGPIVR